MNSTGRHGPRFPAVVLEQPFTPSCCWFLLQPRRDLRLATTTSTDNSGLLRAILPQFELQHGIRVQVISVGTGKALKLAENGDVDVVLVHDRQAEEAFVAAGYGVNRRDVMYNDFVIVGPGSDPAALRGGREVLEAFRQIAARQARFVSRGEIREPRVERSTGTVGWPPGEVVVSGGMGEVEWLARAGHTISSVMLP